MPQKPGQLSDMPRSWTASIQTALQATALVYMSAVRLPLKRLVCGIVNCSNEIRQRQCKRYKDTWTVSLQSFPDTWETTAADRSEWRSLITKDAADCEAGRAVAAEYKRRQRKSISHTITSQTNVCAKHGTVILCCHGDSATIVRIAPLQTSLTGTVMVVVQRTSRSTSL